MAHRMYRLFVKPMGFFLLAMIVVGAIIIIVGETLLAFYQPDFTSELQRPELYVALALAIGVMAVGALVTSRPAGSLGPLDRELAIGGESIFAPEPPPVDVRLRRGEPGTLADIQEGYVLYAQSGPLARVLGILPGEQEYGKRRRGLIYATGMYGASAELWIPIEAVLAVYPETQSVFLAAKGDETEHFGWNLPPESFRRDERRPHQPPSSF
ncbi:MAG: hypothetical protein H0V24_04675 [Chloroflexia bacterium]|nr:hypothetical protein [Chloroflexia bacterium]